MFSAARTRNWSNVFRLSATMTEPVDMAAMRTALDVTVRRFPSIAVRIKPGFFWYYLEELPAAPEFEAYVDRMDFVLGTGKFQRYNISLITFKGKMMFNITRNVSEPLLEHFLYEVLRERGVHVVAESNTRK
jgi:Cys-tRNA synthase (O-phospho-L-seryl-tRNA:Cys-tRNA synthase)